MKHIKKSFIIFLMAITLSISSIIPAMAQEPIHATRRTTESKVYDNVIMIYMVGSDLESQDQSGIDDIKEMLEAEYGSNTIILLQTGGAEKWHKLNQVSISNENIQRFIIQNGEITLLETLANDNMGKAEVLNDFIKFAQNEYPAKAEHLVLWSHGSGPVYGFGADELHESDALDLEELKQALRDTKKLNTIVFDACLMGNLETAFALKDYSKFMIASSELAPGTGLNYEAFANKIATESVADFDDADMKDLTVGEHDTLALIDLSKVDALMNEVATVLTHSKLEDIRAATIASIAYGGSEELDQSYEDEPYESDDYNDQAYDEEEMASEPTDLFDVKGILDQLTNSERAKNLLEQAVLANFTSEGFSQASGLSLYVPIKDSEYLPADASETMDEIGLPSGYLDYMLKLSSLADMDTELNIPESVYESYIDEGLWEDDDYPLNENWDENNFYDYDAYHDQGLLLRVFDYIQYLLFDYCECTQE